MDIKAPGDDWNLDPQEQPALPFDESSRESSAPADPLPTAPSIASATARCNSCGAPIATGDLCAGCASAFQNVLDPTKSPSVFDHMDRESEWAVTPEPPPQAETQPAEQPLAISAPSLDELFAALESAPRNEPSTFVETTPAVEKPLPIETQSFDTFASFETTPAFETRSSFETHSTIETPSTFEAPAPLETPAAFATRPAFEAHAPVEEPAFIEKPAPIEQAFADAQRVVTPPPAALVQRVAPAQPPILEQAAADEAPVEATPTKTIEKTAASSTPAGTVLPASMPAKKSGRSFVAAAAVILAIAAIGVPLRSSWRARQQVIITTPQPAPRPPQPSVPSASKPAPAVRPTASAAVTTHRPAVIPPPAAVAAAPVRPAPVKPAAARTPAFTRTPVPAPPPMPAPLPAPVVATRNPPPVPPKPVTPAVPATTTPTPAAVVAAPVSVGEVVAAPAAPELKPEPAAPLGPFFELSQVDAPPQVTSRVDPQLPEHLQTGPINEIVIARVLVSEAGQPVLVHVIRHSKSGAALDNAVVASIRNWTFKPASKRGDAVSCFMQVAVPIRRSE